MNQHYNLDNMDYRELAGTASNVPASMLGFIANQGGE